MSSVEVLVSNNASTDGTRDALDNWTKDNNFFYVNHNATNLGSRGNMLFLLNKAKGKYVWFPGDDDYLMKGVLPMLINYLKLNPSYLYISRRSVIENTKEICSYAKKISVPFDVMTSVSYKQLVKMLCNNYTDFKFQTSSIFLRENIIEYEKDFIVYDEDVQANCHSLYRSLRSMQDGPSFFISKVGVLSGDEISWQDKVIDYLMIRDPYFVNGLVNFGFSKRDCRQIREMLLAKSVLSFISNKQMMASWSRAGYPGWSVKLIPKMVSVIFGQFLKHLGLSTSYTKVALNASDFFD